MQSGVGKLSCNKTALKRCTSTEALWNTKAPSMSSPEDEIFFPKLPKSWHAVYLFIIIIIIMITELSSVLGSQPAGDVSHKPGGGLTLLSARPTVGVNSLPKTVTRQRRGCDLNPGPTAPESSTLTIRLPSHPAVTKYSK